MSRVCITLRTHSGVGQDFCTQYTGGETDDAIGVQALETAIANQAAQLRAQQLILPASSLIRFTTPGRYLGIFDDHHSMAPNPTTVTRIRTSLLPPQATPATTPATAPTSAAPQQPQQPSLPPLHEGPQFSGTAPALTTTSTRRDRLISYLMTATTWADLRDTHDRTRSTNPQTGLFNLMYDDMSGTAHNPSWMADYDINSTQTANWMRGTEPMPGVTSDNPRLNEIEMFLDRAPSAPNTERERVRTITDPRLGTWLILGPHETTPAGYETREHSKLAVAFHNLRTLIELVNTQPVAARQTPIIQNLQTLMTTQCRTRSSDSRCATVVASSQQNWVPGEDANALDANELTHIAEYTAFFGLQPTFSGSPHGWGQNAIKYTVQMLRVYNAFIRYYNEARGS